MYMFLVECLFGVCRTKQISGMVKKIGRASWQKENLDKYLLQYSTLFLFEKIHFKTFRHNFIINFGENNFNSCKDLP